MVVPFGQPHFGDEEIEAVTAVLRSGWVGMGPQTLQFETELEAWLDVPRVVTVSSCTGALFLALLSHGIGPGDEVICPSLTWCSTANAALYLGATPVFCDVDRASFCVTPETILARVTHRTKAVIVVHYGGLAVDVATLRRALPPHIVLIEDAAHALGARTPDGARVGASGNLVCFSFYANKNISTGEGGAIALADPDAANHLASLRQHALTTNAWRRYSHPESSVGQMKLHELGFKLNYTDLQAAIGRVQLRRQAEFAAHRLAIARFYLDELAKKGGFKCQTGLGGLDHAHHLFVTVLPDSALRRKSRDDIMRRVRNRGIGLSVHYVPLHRMPLYHTGVCLPVTEELADRIVTLPIGAAMTMDDARQSLDALFDEIA
ncbi:DegT/DnrJ/EryC1/StrS aminotransferase family protein [Magnetospirillum sp. SS-4]|uniref:DegT/DnrJ/EryC1/StrS family aminotransferase n=1 Tax=Magnetospirillum sp. SS-4 TaxID=2681465 RepID=UPI0020C5984A|nr:DegT/DnrJ/EryC1/StrS family aminotransferase [Magnetospirillum sp. SS-4]